MSSQIHRISKIFLLVCYALLIIIPTLVLLQWFAIDSSLVQSFIKPFGFFNPIMTSQGAVYFVDHHFSFIESLIGFVGTAIGLSPLILALVLLIKIFKNYCIGNIFSLKNAIYYKYLGHLFFFDALLAKPICQALLTMSATLSNALGHREIQVSFTNLNLESLFCGAIIIVIARVMHIGSKIQEEQQLVI